MPPCHSTAMSAAPSELAAAGAQARPCGLGEPDGRSRHARARLVRALGEAQPPVAASRD